jgi:hypothetical protein
MAVILCREHNPVKVPAPHFVWFEISGPGILNQVEINSKQVGPWQKSKIFGPAKVQRNQYQFAVSGGFSVNKPYYRVF